jgi:excisionase family DNA binding protein
VRLGEFTGEFMDKEIKIKRKCLYCGNEFIAHKTTTKYCSHTCNQKHYKQIKRDEKVKKSNRNSLSEVKSTIEDINKKEFLSISEICFLFNVSRTTIWRLCKNKNLKAVKIGKQKFIRKEQINNFFLTEDIEIPKKPEVIEYRKEDFYSLKEIREKYKISEGALYNLIKRNNIQKKCIRSQKRY